MSAEQKQSSLRRWKTNCNMKRECIAEHNLITQPGPDPGEGVKVQCTLSWLGEGVGPSVCGRVSEPFYSTIQLNNYETNNRFSQLKELLVFAKSSVTFNNYKK